MWATLVKFYRDASPPQERGDRVVVAAFGASEFGAKRLPNGEIVTPETIPKDTEPDIVMGELIARRSFKRHLPYDVYFVLRPGQGEEGMSRRVQRCGTWQEVHAYANGSAQAVFRGLMMQGTMPIMTGYRKDAAGEMVKKGDIFPVDFREEGDEGL